MKALSHVCHGELFMDKFFESFLKPHYNKDDGDLTAHMLEKVIANYNLYVGAIILNISLLSDRSNVP